jgi:uncharacterized protein (TIGR04255 family)
MKNISYKKPILIEQFVELYLAKRSLSQDSILSFIPHLKSQGFDIIEMGVVEGITINIVPEKKEEITRLPSSPRIRCWNSQRNKLVQLFEDRIAVHQVGEYLGYTDFKNLLSSIIKLATETLTNFKVESVAFQTIDQYKTNFDSFLVSKFFNCSGEIIPKWYESSKESFDITLGRGLINSTDGQNRQIYLSARDDAAFKLISMRCVCHSQLLQKSVLICVDELHDESCNLFEKIITDTVRNEVMRGVT